MRSQRRRLRALASHTAGAAAVETAVKYGGLPHTIPSDRLEQDSAAGQTQTAMQIVGRLKQDGMTGEVLPSELERLRAAEIDAASRADYLLAAELKRVRDVLAPRPKVSPLECAPTSPKDQIEFFLRNGFCIVPNVVEGEHLTRLQAAWEKAVAPERARWEAAKADNLRSGVEHPHLLSNGTYAYDSGRFYPESTFDVPGLLAADDAFLEVIDSPKLVPLLSAVVGSGGVDTEHYRATGSPYNGVMRAGGMGGRIVPVEGNHGTHGQSGYISWQ